MPRALQDLVGELLGQGWTRTGITEAVNAELARRGEQPVSRSSVHRYATRMLSEGRRIREIHEAAATWSRTIGPIDGGEVDAYLVELVRALAVDHMHLFTEGEGEDEGEGEKRPTIREISDLALAMRRLVGAQEQADKRIAAARARAADDAADAARSAGLKDDTIQQIRERVLGVG